MRRNFDDIYRNRPPKAFSFAGGRNAKNIGQPKRWVVVEKAMGTRNTARWRAHPLCACHTIHTSFLAPRA